MNQRHLLRRNKWHLACTIIAIYVSHFKLKKAFSPLIRGGQNQERIVFSPRKQGKAEEDKFISPYCGKKFKCRIPFPILLQRKTCFQTKKENRKTLFDAFTRHRKFTFYRDKWCCQQVIQPQLFPYKRLHQHLVIHQLPLGAPQPAHY